MRFTSAIFAALALASSALAQTPGFAVMTSPTQDQEIPAGSSFDLIWTPGTPTGLISIVLLQGATASTLQLGPTLASGVPSTLGKFTYSVPTTSSFKTYGFKITLDSDPTVFQYSFPFHISGASSSSSSSSSATGSVTSAHSSSSSSYVTGVSTSVQAPTSSAVANATSSSTTVKSSSTIASVPVSTPYTTSNSTGTTLLSTTASATKTSPVSTAAGGSATSTHPAIVSGNAAVAKVASAGLALGGVLMAFAL